jgi:hypothetical protein
MCALVWYQQTHKIKHKTATKRNRDSMRIRNMNMYLARLASRVQLRVVKAYKSIARTSSLALARRRLAIECIIYFGTVEKLLKFATADFLFLNLFLRKPLYKIITTVVKVFYVKWRLVFCAKQSTANVHINYY